METKMTTTPTPPEGFDAWIAYLNAKERIAQLEEALKAIQKAINALKELRIRDAKIHQKDKNPFALASSYAYWNAINKLERAMK